MYQNARRKSTLSYILGLVVPIWIVLCSGKPAPLASPIMSVGTIIRSPHSSNIPLLWTRKSDWFPSFSNIQNERYGKRRVLVNGGLQQYQQLHRRALAAAYGSGRRGGTGYGRRGGGGGGQGGFDLSNWTNRLLALNVVIFILQQFNPSITLLGAKNDKLIRRGEYHRFLTPMLLHANVQHIMANSYTMYNLGHFIEPLFGGPTYLALYVISGFLGNYMSFATGTAPISIGASTAVSGLMGALGYFCLRHRNIWQGLESPLRSVAQAIVINGVLGASNPGIDNFGHLGGLLGGIACGALFGPRMVPVSTSMGIRYVNQPLLQATLAKLNLRGQSSSDRWGGNQSNRRHGSSFFLHPPATTPPPTQQSQQQLSATPARTSQSWISRLGDFLHRGGGGTGHSPAFILSPSLFTRSIAD